MTEDEFINKIKKLQEPDESFIYFWMHPELNLKYIGSHHGNPDDGYTGSGIDFKEQLKKNPIEEWDRIILAYTSGDQQYDIEELFLKFFNVANDPNFLNRTDTAGGFGVGENHNSYIHGILVGRPKDYEARKKWFNELPPEHQERYTEWITEYQKEYQREWYKNNKEYKLRKVKEWREKNKEIYSEKQRKYNKDYREKNKEELARKNKEYREKNPEIVKQNKERRRIRRKIIKEIIKIDSTYTEEYFKGMKFEEVKKIEENVKNSQNTLERFL